MSDSVLAKFWFALGVEVYPGRFVPKPPSEYIRLGVSTPIAASNWRDPYSAPLTAICAEFRLDPNIQWHPSHWIAHYDLISSPPDGYTWRIVNDRIVAYRSGSRALELLDVQKRRDAWRAMQSQTQLKSL